MKKILYIILLLTGIFCSASIYSQITVVGGTNIGMTPEQFINTYLLGSGVTVVPGSATFNGNTGSMSGLPPLIANQIGTFTTTGIAYDKLQLHGGIIMSSGNVEDAPTDPSCLLNLQNCPVASTGTNSGGDDDLTVLMEGTNSHDKSILEFDFIPQTDILTFRYVFASEEFDYYCTSQYNDAFGFLISGPGCGTTPPNIFTNNAENIALLPNTTDYVTIHNICDNKPLYSWCNLMDLQCEDGSGPEFSYNRFTFVFTAEKVVTACSTYHMKICIGDAGDQAYDSGVFLEQNSFSSNNITFNNTYTFPNLGDFAVEGCSNATVTFQLGQAAAVDQTINFTLGGTATPDGPGVPNPDYGITPAPSGTPFPTSIVIPAGQTSANIIIYPYMDTDYTESDETVTFTVTNTTCSGSTSSTNTVIIKNNTPLTVTINNSQPIVCFDVPVNLTAVPSGGQPIYTYLWSDGSTANPAIVTPPVGMNTYNVTATDGCTATASNSTNVEVKPLPTITSPATPSTELCSGETLNIPLQSSPPGATYTWTVTCDNSLIQTCPPASGGSVITDQLTLVNSSIPADVTYQIQPSLNGCDGYPVQHIVHVLQLPDVRLANFAPVCLNTPPFTLTGGTPAGGTYTLNGNTITIFDPASAGVGTHWITYTYTDANGCTSSDQKSILVQSLITPTISGSTTACLGVSSPFLTDAGMGSYQWSVVPNGTIQTGANPWEIGITWPTTGPKTITVTYTDPNGCTTIPANKPVTVNPLPTPTITTGNFNVCYSQSYSYTTQSGMTNYSWNVSPGNTITFTGNTATVTWNVIGPTEWIEVNYTDANGCTAVIPARTTVNVNPLPDFAVSGSENVCAGSVNVTYSLPVGQIGSWSIPTNGGSITGASTNVNSINVNWFINAAPAQSIVVSYTNTLGCTNMTTKSVYVQSLPVATFTTTTPSPVCQDFPTPSLYTVDPGGPLSTYLWQVTPAAYADIADPTANPASITWKLTGDTPQTAQLMLTATTSGTNPVCSSTSSPLTVTINPKPNTQLVPCFDLVTSRSAKRFLLKGGTPLLTSTPLQGEYLSNPLTPALIFDGSNYFFDPSLVPGTQISTFYISYKYTSTQFGCPATSSPLTLTVYGINPPCGTSMTDYRDGTSYRTSLIGGKCWMMENLRYGSSLTPTTAAQTDNCVVEKYCLSTDPSCTSYGGLYQWDELIQYGVTTPPEYQGVCPPGWHIPTAADYQALIDANQGNALAGSALTDLNLIPRGFEALLNGMFYLNTSWAFLANNLPRGTMFWTSTPGSGNKIVTRGMNNKVPSVSLYESSKINAFPVRCVKD